MLYIKLMYVNVVNVCYIVLTVKFFPYNHSTRWKNKQLPIAVSKRSSIWEDNVPS